MSILNNSGDLSPKKSHQTPSLQALVAVSTISVTFATIPVTFSYGCAAHDTNLVTFLPRVMTLTNNSGNHAPLECDLSELTS
ncbi:hypothetical protein [Paraburkholderia sp. MM6662-R1]|uniref:hypothetical protein n=1 Tax=Paraburkholderia sp. MM6662-R1 TaxID=2991066 RepID=UPI003D1998DC